MRSWARLIFVALSSTISICAVAYAQPEEARRPVHVLFVGNSLTYFNAMPSMVGEILKDSDPSFEIQSEMLAQGGATIRDHLNADSVQRTLKATHFDVVVFQELGGFPACPSDFRGCSDSPSAVKEMVSVTRAAGARPIWFSTWQSSREAQEKLSSAAKALAGKLHVEVADAGAVIFRYMELDPTASALRSDGHPEPLGSWIIAEVIASAIHPHHPRHAGSIEVCGPDWKGHDPKLTSLSSSQAQPPQRCFSISGKQMIEIQRAEGDLR